MAVGTGTAILGAGALGAGTSLLSSFMQSNAAEEAARSQSELFGSAQTNAGMLSGQALGATQPFRDVGQAAGTRLSQLLGLASADPRVALRRELETTQAQLADMGRNHESYFPVLSGPYASERRQQQMNATVTPLNAKVADLQAKLKYYEEHPDEIQAGPGAAQFAFTPIYDYQRNIGVRNLDRSLAARGLFGSGAGVEKELMLDQALQAEDVNRQLTSLLQTFNIGAQAGTGAANVLQNQSNTLANLLTANAIAQGSGITGSANAQASGIAGISNAFTGSLGLGLQAQQSDRMLDILDQLSVSQRSAGGASSIPGASGTIGQQNLNRMTGTSPFTSDFLQG